jgi:HSP20 family protein
MIATTLTEKPRAFDRFNKMMEEVFRGEIGVWTPLVDVKVTPKELIFVAELPGMEQKDVDVELNGDVLTIRGRRDFKEEETKDDYVRIERGYGKFQRSFMLDTPVKSEAIKAVFKDGLLKVSVPKADNRPAVKIPVKGV